MGNVSLSISIPLDDDGYTEMECDFCKTRFMITGDDYENKDMPFFFCPVCGLPNNLSTFYCPEVLEKAAHDKHDWREAGGVYEAACREVQAQYSDDGRDDICDGDCGGDALQPRSWPDMAAIGGAAGRWARGAD